LTNLHYNCKFVITRKIEVSIKKYLRQFSAVMISGPRQAGKSTKKKQKFCPKYKYVTLEDPSIREQITADPWLFFDELPKFLIFDEIQYLPEILVYIKMIIDRERNIKGRFILTGSQQFRSMKGISETLAGRIGILHLLPLSFEETTQKDSLKIFTQACLRGSYPEIFLHSDYDSRAWYDSYTQTFLERDIKSIYDIGSLRDFHRFMRLLASRCGQLLNLSSLAADLGVAVNTVKKYLFWKQAILYTCSRLTMEISGKG